MLRPGSIAQELTITHVVGEQDLAPHVAATGTGGGPEHNLFPLVLGTAKLIAWMELAAAKAMEPMLLPGELTAGIVVRVEHHAPTPLGGTVRMTAPYGGSLTSLDIHTSPRAQDDIAGKILHRTLYNWDSAKAQPVLELAKEVAVSSDGMVYTYKLLDNATEHKQREHVGQKVRQAGVRKDMQKQRQRLSVPERLWRKRKGV